jgi:UDP-N-acetylglucosamine acyltransferase
VIAVEKKLTSGIEMSIVTQQKIHPSAVVDSAATIGEGVTIGPYAVIGPKVKIGRGTAVAAHAVIQGDTTIGQDCQIFSFSAIGTIPQDLKYAGEPGQVVIGDRTTVREHVTINLGTSGGGLVTSIANDCLLMTGVHVAHDCQIHNNVILVNNVILGGHVVVNEHCVIGGHAGVHQFVNIGRYSMVGGMSRLVQDVAPYSLISPDDADFRGLNLVGLRRNGFNRTLIRELQQAYEIIYGDAGTLVEKIVIIKERFTDNALVADVVAFLENKSKRKLVSRHQR